MENFRRSLRYLWPYRKRLAISIVCVIVIAILWAGGLGALLPGAKILISPEGLHGWAWNSMTEDRLGIGVVQRLVPSQVRIEGLELSLVMDVVDVAEKGPAFDRIRKTEWLIGLDDGVAAHRLMRADALAKLIADIPAGTKVRLRLYDPAAPLGDSNPRIVTLTTAKAGFAARILAGFARRLPDDRFRLLLLLLAFGVVITILRDLLRFVQEYLVASAVWRAIMDLRCENYNVVLRLPTTFFSEKGVSDTMSRFVRDSSELARGQVTLFGKTLVEPAKAAGAIMVAMIFSWKLTLLAMVAGPPTFLLIRKFGKVMKRASRRALESWSEMLAVLEETLTGIRVVKAYTMEGSERRRFFRTNRRLLKQQQRMAKIDSATAPAVEALGIIAAMGAVAIAGYWVFNNQMKPESFLALMACLAAMFDPMRKLAKVVTRFQRAEAAAKRLFELQDTEQEKRVPNAPTLPRHSRSIEFRNVSFRYPSASDDALKEINLTISAEETVAIVGPNGSGKTTLVSLLPRLLDPTSGKVFIDGQDIAACSLRSLRRQIGLMTQDTVLFHATIAENIAYGLRRPKKESVLAASKKAFVDEFVADLPGGYETMVGEHGATLSGGQRQRIAIARAILRDPAILIFDEAMSQIDTDSDRKIQQAMQEFVRGRTTLMDTGTHRQLLERCELYRHLYKRQFADEDG